MTHAAPVYQPAVRLARGFFGRSPGGCTHDFWRFAWWSDPRGRARARLPVVPRHPAICPAQTAGRPTPFSASPATCSSSATTLKPDYLLCAFDLPEPTFRSELYPDYKAHRTPPPDDLNAQVPRIQAVIEAMNLPVLTATGFEADDVMATVAVAAEKRGLDVLLATSDKDCRQLITDRVRLFNLRKRAEFGRAELLADWGVAPEQVVDFQTLVGDSVDNVPGVPGVGPKTAAKLLQQYGTLDNLLAHVDDLPKGKMKENIRAYSEKVLLEPQARPARHQRADGDATGTPGECPSTTPRGCCRCSRKLGSAGSPPRCGTAMSGRPAAVQESGAKSQESGVKKQTDLFGDADLSRPAMKPRRRRVSVSMSRRRSIGPTTTTSSSTRPTRSTSS